MSVSDKDREDNEAGNKDRGQDWLGEALRVTVIDHPTSDAYHKGLSGEPLDADKKDR
jgi:hypothetical protein